MTMAQKRNTGLKAPNPEEWVPSPKEKEMTGIEDGEGRNDERPVCVGGKEKGGGPAPKLKPVIIKIERIAAASSPMPTDTADSSGTMKNKKDTGGSAAPAACWAAPPPPRRGTGGHRSGEETDGSMASSSSSRPTQVKKRKRGRPPTTGEYINYALAKKAAQEAEREQLALDLFRDRYESAGKARTSGLPLPSQEEVEEELRAQPTGDVAARVLEEMDRVERMATTSNNLKGTYVRRLRVAARVAKVAAGELTQRTEARGSKKDVEDENRRLKARVCGLEKEVGELKRMIEDLKARGSVTSPVYKAATTMRPRRAAMARRETRAEDFDISSEEEFPPLPPPKSPRTCPLPAVRGGEVGKSEKPSPTMRAPTPILPATTAARQDDLYERFVRDVGAMVEGQLASFKREIKQADQTPSLSATQGNSTQKAAAKKKKKRRTKKKKGAKTASLPNR